ncbi:biotin/lipoate A/B protein ligase family protein [Nocardioides sp.]|uniref:lipoate--protein ligase family protein n=1 Tax=Nocardioides sp. TaxID=35761 RepID=UPI003527FFEA
MSGPFGDGPVRVLDPVEARVLVDDLEGARARVSGLVAGEGAVLALAAARPTAAFSRRDTLLPGFEAASTAVAAHGYPPVLRPVGGRLAVYDEGSLVLQLLAPHPEPTRHLRERFSLMGEALAAALRSLGVDARVGRVPGEYCEGEFSVNHAGLTKLVGTGQRLTGRGFLFSAVVMVHGADRARAALVDGYAALGLELRPETVGCVADALPDVTLGQVSDAILGAVADVVRTEA